MTKHWWTELTELDPDQASVFKLPVSGRYFVTGPAGSGKTNLLLLRARYLARMKIENYAVIVYNGPLKKYLTSELGKGVAANKTYTFVSWLQKQHWALMGDDKGQLPDDWKLRRALLCDRVHEYLTSKNVRGLIDTILVDEVQDYTPKELELFAMMATNLFLVGDIRQQIFQSSALKPAIQSLISPQHQIELRFHYRIGEQICRLADRIAKVSKGHSMILEGCRYDEESMPSRVQHFQAPLSEQLKRAGEAISQQVDAYPDELIGVFCPRKEDVRPIADFMRHRFGSKVLVQASDGEYQDFVTSEPIVCSSLHNAKGLEFRCVHILGCDGLKGMPRNRELIYTGVTRAKTSLDIYYDGELIEYLADALAAALPPQPLPSHDSIF